MSLELGVARSAAAWSLASGLLLAASSASATSGEAGRTPACHHPSQSANATRAAHARSVRAAETVLVSLIDAGTTAWNATLGGLIPAPEIVLKRVDRV